MILCCIHCEEPITPEGSDPDSIRFCSRECGDAFDADLAHSLNDEGEQEWW